MSSIYASGTSEIAQHFGVSSTVSLLGVSMYCMGLSFGPVLAAPLSETFGRAIVYRSSLPLAALFTIGCGVAKNIETIVICRFFAGFFAAPALSIGGGSIADIFDPSARGVAMSLFLLAPLIGPALGPVVGGFVVEKKGWRWLEWVMLFLILITWLYSLPLQESYKHTILEKRRKRHGLAETPSSSSRLVRLRTFMTTVLFRPIMMLLTEPIVAFFSLYVAVDFGVLYIFLASFPLVYSRVYHFNSGEIGLTFLPILVGCILAACTSLLCDKFLYQKQLLALRAANESSNSESDEPVKKHVEPEHRLYPAMIGSIGLPAGLFWFGWTARPGVHWASPVVATMLFSFGNLCVFVSSMTYLIDSYGPRYGASATSANGFLRYIFAAAFPLFAIQMYDKLGIDWATSLLGFISICLLPIPWILFKWGPKIREKSAYTITER
ncbi:major facilitator superfamily domain-containing protein [Xylogone sp. PMI_703]|nr:major facilitator superfamily domain-containing protein [Xylogone sp. PMI_703]